jgi:hypothetical protein
MGIGMQELIILFFVAFLIAFTALPFILRKRYPDKLWLGLVLCLLNPGMGQFYLLRGLKYFIGLFVLFMILKQVVGSGYAWMVSDLASVGIMYRRFLRKSEKPWMEKV